MPATPCLSGLLGRVRHTSRGSCSSGMTSRSRSHDSDKPGMSHRLQAWSVIFGNRRPRDVDQGEVHRNLSRSPHRDPLSNLRRKLQEVLGKSPDLAPGIVATSLVQCRLLVQESQTACLETLCHPGWTCTAPTEPGQHIKKWSYYSY